VSDAHGPGGTIAVGADHAGFRLKRDLVSVLEGQGWAVRDAGTHDTEPVDYPEICATVGRDVAAGRAWRGLVAGGSGQGEQIAANKVAGVRAALCTDLYTARLSRAHNDANVLALGARVITESLAEEILSVWLATDFEGGRHARRVEQLADIERASGGIATGASDPGWGPEAG